LRLRAGAAVRGAPWRRIRAGRGGTARRPPSPASAYRAWHARPAGAVLRPRRVRRAAGGTRPGSSAGEADVDVLYVVVSVNGLKEGLDFFQLLRGQAGHRVLRTVAELGRVDGETLLRQGLAHGVEVGRVGDEQGAALVIRDEILGAGFDGGQFRVGIVFAGRLDQADMVEVPAHRAGSTQLALAEQHTDLGHGAVHVVGQALDDERHLMRGETLVQGAFVVDHFTGQPGAFLDGALQGVLGHGRLLCLV